MKKLRWAAASALLIPSLAMAWPWSTDMMDQLSIKPQHGPMGIRPFPEHSVPVPSTKTSTRIASMDEADNTKNPVPATPESIHNGQKLFEIICTPCHNYSGKGDGPVGMKLVLQPFDLTSDRIQHEVTEGHIFGYMTFGGAIMPSYANDLYPNERWDIVNFVRHGLLQYSQDWLKTHYSADRGNLDYTNKGGNQ